MSYIKTGVDSGDSKASIAIKPFHNFLVNNFREMRSTSSDVFSNVDYLQLYLIVGGKINPIKNTSIGDRHRARRIKGSPKN